MNSYPIRSQLILSVFFLIFTPVITAQTNIRDFASKPPLGFNSFDSYRSHLSQDKAYALMDVMAEKYLPHGYEYFVMDAGWYYNVELYPGSNYPKKRLGLALDGVHQTLVAQAGTLFCPGYRRYKQCLCLESE